MAFKSIAIAADHAGFDLKAKLADELKSSGYEVIDLGTRNGTDSVDYPDFGKAVAEAVTSGKADAGVVVCGTGIGISIAVNRHRGARAASPSSCSSTSSPCPTATAGGSRSASTG